MTLQVTGLRLYNLDELSKTLKVDKATLRGYIEQGHLRAVKTGLSYMVTEEDLREFLLKLGRGLGKEEGIELKKFLEGI